MSHFTGCTILPITQADNPNEGRTKINANFTCLEDNVHHLLTGTTASGGTGSSTLSAILSSGNTTGANDILVNSGQVISGVGVTNIINLNDGGGFMLDTASGAYQAGVWANGNYAALYGNDWGPAFDVMKDSVSDIDVLRMHTSTNGPSIVISEDSRALNIGLVSGLQITNTTSTQNLSSGAYASNVSGLTSILTSINSMVSRGAKNCSIIGGSGHTINPSLQNTVIIAGNNITADTSNTLFVQRAYMDEYVDLNPQTVLPSPVEGRMFYSGGSLNKMMINTGGTSSDWVAMH